MPMFHKSQLFQLSRFFSFFWKINNAYFLNEERSGVNIKTASCIMFKLNIRETLKYGW